MSYRLTYFIGFFIIISLLVSQPQQLFADGFRGGTSWCGNPDLIQPAENPYLQLAELNVTRALDSGNAFWLTWGYVAVESIRKGDTTLRDKALLATDALVAEELEKKLNLWELTESLETIYLWQKSGLAPSEQYAKWLSDIQPMVEKNYAMNEQGTYWESAAANTLHQSAVVLKLASILYSSPRYEQMASSCIEKTIPMLEAGGAFRYIRESGPTPLYYGFEVTFLGRYYMLTHDSAAGQRLAQMANYAHDALSNGMWDGASTPWWKHKWSLGGPMHGIEIAAGMARDPIARALAEYRLPLNQPYYYSYTAMYFWDSTIATGTLGLGLCKYNTNYGGPHIRKDGWQVVMPGKAFSDTGVGIAIVKSNERFAFDAYLETAAIDVVAEDNVDQPYKRPNGAYLVTPAEQIDGHRGLATCDWIASAWCFEPRMPYYGNATAPPSKGWHNAQVWFADKTGMAGWMISWKDASGIAAIPRGFLSVGHAPVMHANGRVDSGQLQMQVWGQDVTALSVFNQTQMWVDFAGHDPQQISVNQPMGYGLSAWPQGEDSREIAKIEHSTLLAFQVSTTDGQWTTLLLNPTSNTQSIELVASQAQVWRCKQQGESAGSMQSETLGNLSVESGELVVIPEMVLIGQLQQAVID